METNPLRIFDCKVPEDQPVIDRLPRVAQVVTSGPTTCLALASWDFEAVIAEQPSVAMAILRELAGRLRELTRELSDAHHH